MYKRQVVDNLLSSTGFGPAPLTALAGAAVGVTGSLSQADPAQGRVWSLAATVAALGSLVWAVVLVVQLVKAGFDMGSYVGSGFWLTVIAGVLGLGWQIYVAVRVGLRALTGHPESVSYTHLDVYKRHVSAWSRAASTAGLRALAVPRR